MPTSCTSTPSQLGNRLRRCGVVAVTCAVSVGLAPAALAADPSHPVIPTQQDVAAAQNRVANASRSVHAIQAALAAANSRLQQVSEAAAQAAEAYNGAVLQWQQARAAAAAAKSRADRQVAKASHARDELAGLVVSQQATSTGMTALHDVLTAHGVHRLLAQVSGDQSSQLALSADFQRWKASSRLAHVYAAAARQALAKAAVAKRQAAEAKTAAEGALTAQQSAVSALTSRRQTLISQLAAAQHVSVRLAAARQRGLEQRREQRLAQQRRERLRREQRQQARVQAQARRAARQAARQHRSTAAHNPAPASKPSAQDSHPAPAPAPQPSPSPAPQPTPPPNPAPPAPSGGAAAAVAFAYAQLGEPYVFGAAGPNAWDCSGLTMAAWASAGVALPHYAASQYAVTTPISASQLQPGDLVFWATNPSDPSTIFHVGLYIGNGDMIHAPYPGETVRVESIYDWEMPDFFSRP